MGKFKVGDVVRIVRIAEQGSPNDIARWSCGIGYVGPIVGIHGTRYKLEVPNLQLSPTGWLEGELELAKPYIINEFYESNP